jgi:hypothetical protein
VCRSTLGCHTRESAYPVRRGLSILIAKPLEYWVARSSRATSCLTSWSNPTKP